MRIGIDARFYGPLGKGLGRYTEKLIEHLEELDDHNEYRIFLRRENWDAYQPRSSRFQKVLADYRWYSFAEQTLFPLTLARERCDLVHFPHFNVPLMYRKSFVVTVHDLILTHYPTLRATTLGPLMYAFKNLAYAVVIRHALHHARRVITVSAYSRRDIIENFQIPDERVAVTTEAVDTPARTLSDETLKQFLAQRGIRKPFLLFVGNAYPHKNLERLVQAFKGLSDRRPDVQLVITGKEDYFVRQLRVYIRKLGCGDAVRFPGFVTDEELFGLYRSADAFVFPSLYEGFGLPPLESMAVGTPVVASRAAAIPEILGDAAVYFDPHNIHDMIEAIERVLTDASLRSKLREKGASRVAAYTWKRLATETLAIYTLAV